VVGYHRTTTAIAVLYSILGGLFGAVSRKLLSLSAEQLYSL